MQIEFIGHGLKANNKLNVGDQMATSFKSPHYDSFIGFVAFAALSGVSKLLSSLLIAQGKYKKLIFFIGIDNNGTSKEALELLLEKNIETFIYHKTNKQITYHPKLFLFEGIKHTRLIIGSSNLTYSGFLNNIEASVQLDFRPITDKQGNKVLKEVKAYFSDLITLTDINVFKLTKELINKYSEQGLLYSHFKTGSAKENQPNDGENINEEILSTPFFTQEFGNGLEPSEPKNKIDRNIKITANDYEVFPYFLEKYFEYRRDVKDTGAVSRNTDQVDLLNWYNRIKELLRNDALPDDLVFELIDADFPIGSGWEGLIRKVWDKNYAILLSYKESEQKHLDFTYVPQTKNRNSKYYFLGGWCARQKLRRKGLKTPAWTEYEEEKMRKIEVNYLFDVAGYGSNPKDKYWESRLNELIKYYDNESNYKTIPNQNIKIGDWLNEQISLKLTGSRSKIKLFLHPVREKLLGEVLQKNGVEWKWQEQKEREEILRRLEEWRELVDFESNLGNRKPTSDEVVYFKDVRDWKARTRNRSKKWDILKEKWKIELLTKAGFPLPKRDKVNV